MRTYLADALSRFASWLRPKALPPVLTGSQWNGGTSLDAYRRNRAPTPNELLAELKNTAWACASLNAGACASFPPKLYVTTRPDQPRPKCLTKALPPATEQRLRAAPHLSGRTKSAHRIEEVAEHPLLDLLAQVNPVMNAFDLWTNTHTIRVSPDPQRSVSHAVEATENCFLLYPFQQARPSPRRQLATSSRLECRTSRTQGLGARRYAVHARPR